MTREEQTLLIYFETCEVDCFGFVKFSRMNADDNLIARRWNDCGYLQFGRLKISELQRLNKNVTSSEARTHVVRLSDAAWHDAARLRRERAERMCKPLDEYELCGRDFID